MWNNWLKEGRKNVNDNARFGCLSSSTADENIKAEKKMILNNRRITIIGVTDDDILSMKRASAQNILIVESLLKRPLMMLAYRSAHAKQFLLMF